MNFRDFDEFLGLFSQKMLMFFDGFLVGIRKLDLHH